MTNNSKVVVSFSELDAYRQCPMKHALAYKQRWTRPQEEESALNKGKLWHAVMEEHYNIIKAAQHVLGRRIHKNEERGVLETCWSAVARHLADPISGEQSDIQALVEWMYRGHVAMWGADLDWLIVAVEHSAEVPLPSPSGRASNRYYLKIKIDLVVRDREGRLLVVDHKSCKNLPTDKELDIDDQFGLYTVGMRMLGFPVFGSIHSAARTQRNKGDQDGTNPQPLDGRFKRSPMYRTETELTNLLADAAAVARAAYGPGSDNVYSSPDTDRCRWRCDFLDAHLMARKGIPIRTVLRDQGFVINKERH